MRPAAELLLELEPDPVGGERRSLVREVVRDTATMSSGRSFHSMSGRLFWKDRDGPGGPGRAAGGGPFGADGGGGGGAAMPPAVENPGRFTAAAVTVAGMAEGCWAA